MSVLMLIIVLMDSITSALVDVVQFCFCFAFLRYCFVTVLIFLLPLRHYCPNISVAIKELHF